MGGSAHLNLTVGAIVAVGGIAGYVKGKSLPSLVGGCVMGGLILARCVTCLVPDACAGALKRYALAAAVLSFKRATILRATHSRSHPLDSLQAAWDTDSSRLASSCQLVLLRPSAPWLPHTMARRHWNGSLDLHHLVHNPFRRAFVVGPCAVALWHHCLSRYHHAFSTVVES